MGKGPEVRPLGVFLEKQEERGWRTWDKNNRGGEGYKGLTTLR